MTARRLGPSLAALAVIAAGALVSVQTTTAAVREAGDWSYTPTFLVTAHGGADPQLELGLDLGGDTVPGRITIDVPNGFPIFPQRPDGLPVGSAELDTVEGAYGSASSSLLTGQIDAQPLDATREAEAQSCSPGTHVAVWIVHLLVLGKQVELPLWIGRAGPGDPPDSSLKIDLCTTVDVGDSTTLTLPLAAAAFVFPYVPAPKAEGSYVWRAVVTPLAPDGHTLLADDAFELRSVVPVPHQLTLRGSRLHGAARLAGRLTAAGRPEAGVTVAIERLVRRILPDGSVEWDDAPAGRARTDKAGRYSLRVPLKHTSGFTAYTGGRVTSCRPAAAHCLSTTEDGTQSDPITLSVP